MLVVFTDHDRGGEDGGQLAAFIADGVLHDTVLRTTAPLDLPSL